MADETVRAEVVAEDKTGPGVASAKRNLSSLQRDLKGGAMGFDGVRIASQGASSAMSTFAAGAAGAGAVIGALGLAKLAGGLIGIGRGALQSYVEFERLGTSLNALAAKEALITGQASTMQQALAQTATQSKDLLNWVQKLAIESPFKQEDVANAFRLSMALGFSTKEAQRLTTAMIDFSTATGAEGYAMEQIARALGQINTKGRLSMEEVNQLTEAGVDVMRILGDATGQTGKQLSDSISKGAVSARTAIEAILTDTERLYAGSAKASASSMAGIISSLEEMGTLTSRNFFSGAFQEVQPYLDGILTVVTAPEFQAGVTAWGTVFGNFTADQLQNAASALERVGTAIGPLLEADAPPWLTILAGLTAAGDYNLKFNITPKVTKVETPDGGLKMEVTPYATTITSKDGGLLKVDVVANRVTIDADTTDNVRPVNLVADWKEGTLGSLIAAAQDGADRKKILLEADWNPQVANVLQALLNVNTFAAKVMPILTINPSAGFASEWGKQVGESIDWDAYKKEWQAAFDSWRPVFSPQLQKSMEDAFANTPIAIIVKINESMLGTLWDIVQGKFNENPVGIFANWAGNVLADLWNQMQRYFSARPLSTKIVTTTGGTDFSVYDPQIRGALPIDVTPPPPQSNVDPRYSPYRRAVGDGYFGGGMAMVGEAGPELVVLPKGTQIYSNRDTKALYGGNVPRFAEGTTALPPWLSGMSRALQAFGLWVPQGGGRQMGPRTRDQAWGDWDSFERKGVQAMQGAADGAEDAFAGAARKVGKAFEGALGNVPGLFGRSQVTDQQMRLANAGLPQNFADDWLRQLNDEVLNGVEWGSNVDIKDAARRAGIDPNLPNDIILELVNQAWGDGSFFANPANLELVNQDAVKADMEQRQKQLQGQQNLLGLFGVTDENLQQQIDSLGTDIAAMFGGASQTDAVKGAGSQVFGSIIGGFSDPATAASGVANMATAITTAAGTTENQQLLYDGGKTAYGSWLAGWNAAALEAPVAPPTGTPTTIPPSGTGGTTPPGRAIGTGYWYGGWMTVHANETVYAPRGAAVYTAHESAGGRPGGTTVVNNYVTINRAIDEEAFLARMARRLRQGY